MGFIVVGHGYKRRSARPKPFAPKVTPWKRKKSFLTQFRNPIGNYLQNQDHHRPHRNSTLESEPVDLIDLPPEVLVSIFSYAGFDESNLLHLTCKYFARLFSPSFHPWLLLVMAQRNSTMYLNAHFVLEPAEWKRKFVSKVSSILQTLRERYKIGTLFRLPLEVLEVSMAFDISIFKLVGVDADSIYELRRFRNMIVCAHNCNDQLKLREPFLEWRLAVLQEFVSKAQELEDAAEPPSAEALLSAADNAPKCVELRDKYNLSSFVPIVKSDRIPEAMFSPVNERLVRKILALSETFDMNFENPARFVAKVLTSQIPIGEKLAESLLSIINMETASSTELLSLLSAFKNCQDSLNSIPLEQRSTHHLQSLVDRLFMVLKEGLTAYHEISVEERQMDSQVWELLYQIHIPELIDHVTAHGGCPTSDFL